MPYIGKHGVATLKAYKYSGLDLSPLANYVFQPFWRRFVNVFPIWLAPNLITLMGFGLVILSCLLAYIYSPYLDTPLPTWVYFAHGILLFFYQTFDAVDGKQARRTNSSSPLGELFDHGCDALTCSFETLALASSFMAGPKVIILWGIGVIPFFFATWEQYHTGTLLLGYVNGPTEGLLLIYFAHFLIGTTGIQWWMKDFRDALRLPALFNALPALSLRDFALICMGVFGLVPTIYLNAVNVHKAVREKGGSLVDAWLRIMPFLALCGLIGAWVLLSPSDVLRNNPFLLISGSGFVFGFLVGRMILAHRTDEPKGLKTHMSVSLLMLPLAVANALSAQLMNGKPFINEYYLLIVYVLFSFTLYLYFVTRVIQEVTTALGISCFSIKKQVHRAS